MKLTKLASMNQDAAKLALQDDAVSVADLIDLRTELDCRLRKTRAQLRKLGRKCRKDESEANVDAYDAALEHLEAWQDLMGIVQSEQARRKAVSSATHKETHCTAPVSLDWLKSRGFSIKDGMGGWQATKLLPPLDSNAAICELMIEGVDGDWSAKLLQGVPDDPKVLDDLVCLTSMKITRGTISALLFALGAPTQQSNSVPVQDSMTP